MARRLVKKQVRTRFCCCPELECRFISIEIPCPNGKLPNGNENPIGKFLWATGFIDEETGEEVTLTSDDILVNETVESQEEQADVVES